MHLRFQGKHFYDFSIHFMEMKEEGPFRTVEFYIRAVTLLLEEGPDIPSASNIRSCLNRALIEKYEISLDDFTRNLTRVTDEQR